MTVAVETQVKEFFFYAKTRYTESIERAMIRSNHLVDLQERDVILYDCKLTKAELRALFPTAPTHVNEHVLHGDPELCISIPGGAVSAVRFRFKDIDLHVVRSKKVWFN